MVEPIEPGQVPPNSTSRNQAQRIKVHVAVVGLNRSPSVCLPSVELNVITPLEESQQFDLTRSITLIKPTFGFIRNPRTTEVGFVSGFVPKTWRAHLKLLRMSALEKQTAILFGNLMRAGTAWNDNFKSLKNYLTFLAALQESWNSVREVREADVVIFCRPDIRISDEIRIVEAVEWCNSRLLLGLSAVGVPAWPFEGMSDRFAVLGGSAIMSYFTRLNQLNEREDFFHPFHSESHLAEVMEGCEVKSIFPEVFVRFRIANRPEPRDLRRLRKALRQSGQYNSQP